MPISFVGSGAQARAGSTSSSTFTFATGLRDEANALATLLEDDLVVIVWGTGSSDDRSPVAPSGYTEQANLYSDDTSDTNLVVWTKFMGAVPDTTVDIPGSGSNSDARGATVFALRGVDTTTPLDVAVSTATGQGQPTPPAISPVTTGAWIVVAAASAAATATELDTPSDLSAATNHWRDSEFNDTFSVMVGTGLKTDWTTGEFSPAAWTSGTGDSWAAVTLALRPTASDFSTSADSGSFVLTGTDASFRKDHRIVANSGGFVLTGFAANLGSQLTISADAGSFTLTGTDVTFTVGRAVVAEPGIFTLTGTAATLEAGYKLVAEVGEFAFSGEDIDLYKGLRLSVDPGSFTLTGDAASFTIAPFVTSWSPVPPPPTGWSGDEPDEGDWSDSSAPPPSWDTGGIVLFDEAIFDSAIFDTGNEATWSEATETVTTWS